MATQDPLEKVRSRVSHVDDCWFWQGSFTSGVPVMWWRGRMRSVRRVLLGRVPRACTARAACGNLSCVAPLHVQAVRRPGKPAAIDRETVGLRHASGVPASALARELNVDRRTVARAARGLPREVSRLVVQPQAALDYIYRELVAGRTQASLAREFGWSRQRFRKLLVEFEMLS